MAGQGRIEDGVHRLPVRVYYEDTDAAGIVYYANHLKFAERARTEMLRCLGLDHTRLREAYGLAFAVRRCAADYLGPARLDDLLEVETRIVGLGGASIDLVQEVRCAGRVIVRLEVRLALLGADLRPARLPGALHRIIAPLVAPAAGAPGRGA